MVKVKEVVGGWRINYPTTLRTYKHYKRIWRKPVPYHWKFRYKMCSYGDIVSCVKHHERVFIMEAYEDEKEMYGLTERQEKYLAHIKWLVDRYYD